MDKKVEYENHPDKTIWEERSMLFNSSLTGETQIVRLLTSKPEIIQNATKENVDAYI